MKIGNPEFDCFERLILTIKLNFIYVFFSLALINGPFTVIRVIPCVVSDRYFCHFA